MVATYGPMVHLGKKRLRKIWYVPRIEGSKDTRGVHMVVSELQVCIYRNSL